ncbi:ROK family transcriptional regulator [Bosea sp. 117]|uniref:ROK family transcriptional regulator n=1 Tax=Bosea sp. 117 TaxID=1125973 RepID=UPI000493B6A1|nr:ROK family transcriptional regulator [Bosea sp. 117]
MLRATNAVKSKLVNLWVVFEAVRIHGPLPRVVIADITGLSKQATSDLVDELLALGFVREEKLEERRVGKPPKPVAIHPDGAFTIGFHVDFGRASAVVMNLGGEVLHRETHPLSSVDATKVAQDLAASVDGLLARARGDAGRFLGIGLATPGPFGVPHMSPPRLPGWDGLILRQALQKATGLPVALANDGQCAVTAEWRFGAAARTLRHFVYLYLGNGLGTGIMTDGSAFGGAHGNAGELGHTIAVPGGHGCICGKRGCLETYVSVDSLVRYLAARGLEVQDAHQLENELAADHPLVAGWIAEAIDPLRSGINTLENLFDPQTIMFGGDAPAWLIEALIERVEPLHVSISLTERTLPRLMKADLGADAVARGAATLPVLAMLNPHYRHLSGFDVETEA